MEQLIAAEPTAWSLREHLLSSHSTAEQVGRVATDAGVGKLILSCRPPPRAPPPPPPPPHAGVGKLILSHFLPGGPLLRDRSGSNAAPSF
jgi:hypothetical protein